MATGQQAYPTVAVTISDSGTDGNLVTGAGSTTEVTPAIWSESASDVQETLSLDTDVVESASWSA